jgi:hypothetical protein
MKTDGCSAQYTNASIGGNGMFGEQLIDLDELILRCRGEKPRKYIADAVACYRVGAFRASIVATWVAMVFDFLYKLDELALTGDQEAIARRSDYEKIRQSGDIRGSLLFEESLLDLAKDKFELISPIEYLDLRRLKEDRNRCAHPTMTSYDEIYQPSAELTRYHLRNAVTHLLQHPPVQGKAALNRLVSEVASPYFPTQPEQVLIQFKSGLLARPRAVLVHNFALVLLKTSLFEVLDLPAIQRYVAALQGVHTMYHPIVEQMLQQRLSDLIRQLDPIQYGRAIQLLELFPEVQKHVRPDILYNLARYVGQTQPLSNPREMVFALEFPPFQAAAATRLACLSAAELRQLIVYQPRPEFIDRALTLYKGADSYANANDVAATLIIPLALQMRLPHLEQVLYSGATNSDIRGSYQFPEVLHSLRTNEHISSNAFQTALIECVSQHRQDFYQLLPFLDEQHFRLLIDILFEKEIELNISFVPGWLYRATQSNFFPQSVIEEIRESYKNRQAVEENKNLNQK